MPDFEGQAEEPSQLGGEGLAKAQDERRGHAPDVSGKEVSDRVDACRDGAYDGYRTDVP